MIILDTHVWIWHISSPHKLSAKAQSSLQKSTRLGVCAISCWELAMLVAKQRLKLDRPVLHWVEQALATDKMELVPLTPAVAVRAATLTQMHGDPADRIIAATATELGVRLVTKDKALRQSDHVDTVW